MPTTYEPIATTTLGSAQASVAFSSISGSYTDLVLVFDGTTSTTQSPALRFNGDTGSNYNFTTLEGDGTSASSARNTNQTDIQFGIVDTTNGVSIAHIQNYSNSTTFKTVLSRGGVASSLVRGYVGMWRNTAAITSITVRVSPGGGNFNSGSTFTLYGIAAA